jgi:hypothetical protein
MNYRVVIAPVALATAISVGAIVDTPSAYNSGCTSSQVQTYSKYGGTSCIAKPNRAAKAFSTVTSGCIVGAFGGTLISILGGCAAGGVGAITGSI